MSAGLHHASKFTVTEGTNITQPAVYGGYVGEYPLSVRRPRISDNCGCRAASEKVGSSFYTGACSPRPVAVF